MHSEPARFLERWKPQATDAGPIAWLRELSERPEHRGAVSHWHVIPARAARHGTLAWPLPAPLAEALESQGVGRLYSHQVHAIERLRARLDTVVVTGTASGKSLCYHAPVVERLLEDPESTALYLFPTKALAQDQLKGLAECFKTQNKLVYLEAHADSRGTEEYNIMLTDRRGNGVKKFLEDLGVTAANMQVVSKGDLVPFRVKIRSASFNNISITPWLLRGVYVPDIITILASLYFILGDIDR